MRAGWFRGQGNRSMGVVCGKWVHGLQAPWAARCGHVACYGCWGTTLAKAHLCPTCGKPAQRHQLIQKFFM